MIIQILIYVISLSIVKKLTFFQFPATFVLLIKKYLVKLSIFAYLNQRLKAREERQKWELSESTSTLLRVSNREQLQCTRPRLNRRPAEQNANTKATNCSNTTADQSLVNTSVRLAWIWYMDWWMGVQSTQGREEQTDITNQEASSRLDLVRTIEKWGSKGTQLVSMLNQAALLAKNNDNREEQKRVA